MYNNHLILTNALLYILCGCLYTVATMDKCPWADWIRTGLWCAFSVLTWPLLVIWRTLSTFGVWGSILDMHKSSLTCIKGLIGKFLTWINRLFKRGKE